MYFLIDSRHRSLCGIRHRVVGNIGGPPKNDSMIFHFFATATAAAATTTLKTKNPFNSSTFNILLFVSCAIGVFIISFSYLSVCTLPLSHMRNPFCFQNQFSFSHIVAVGGCCETARRTASGRDEERKVRARCVPRSLVFGFVRLDSTQYAA